MNFIEFFFFNLVYTQAEHTRAKRARKSPGLDTSTESSASEGKQQIYLLQLPQWLRTYYNTSSIQCN